MNRETAKNSKSWRGASLREALVYAERTKRKPEGMTTEGRGEGKYTVNNNKKCSRSDGGKTGNGGLAWCTEG